ncbi:MAG: carboxypeptidase-like regulatory domain-containing protein [Chitinophagales bacterium]
MLFLTLQTTFVWAQETVIKGLILDYYTKEPLPYADVLFKGTDIGVTADIDGRYEITTTDLTLDKLTVSYTGYDSRNVQITPGITQRATIELKPNEYILDGVDIVAEKKIRKDTAAHTLFRNVIKHKPDNAPDNYDNYIYENYTKTIFGLYDVKDRFKSRIIIRKVPFIFDNIDTIQSSQTTILPGLMKENYKHILYRKDPKKTREILIGDKLS